MDRTTIASIFANSQALDGQQLTVAGWVRSLRDMKTFGFVTLNDGSCFNNLQVVMERESLANYDEISHQNVGAALIVRGTLVLTPDAPQPFELKAATIEVEGPSAPDYPLQKKRHTVEYLRTIAAPAPAHQHVLGATFRVRSVAAYAIHKFFQEQRLRLRAHAHHHRLRLRGRRRDVPRDHHRPGQPTPRPRTAASTAARTSSARRPTSPCPASCRRRPSPMAFGNVYTFGPTFRAEDSNTAAPRRRVLDDRARDRLCRPRRRHEPSRGDAQARHHLRACSTAPTRWSSSTSSSTRGSWTACEHVASSDFGRVTYTEAIEILEKAVAEGHEFEYPVYLGRRPGQTEHERFLTEQHFKKPVFVTDYPKEIKAFYMRLNDDGKTVAATDCLVPGIGEIIGGSPARGAPGAA